MTNVSVHNNPCNAGVAPLRRLPLSLVNDAEAIGVDVDTDTRQVGESQNREQLLLGECEDVRSRDFHRLISQSSLAEGDAADSLVGRSAEALVVVLWDAALRFDKGTEQIDLF